MKTDSGFIHGMRGTLTRSEFYRRWLKVTLLHAFGLAEVLATVLGLAGPPILKFFPSLGGQAQDLLWEIPLTVFIMVAIVRVFLAPYWIYQALAQEMSLPEPTSVASVPAGRVLDRLAQKELSGLYKRCVTLYWQVHSPRSVSDPETRQPMTRDTCRAAKQWTGDFFDFLKNEYGEATSHTALMTLDPESLLDELSESKMREYTDRAIKQIRSIMQRAA